jgi:hypothetical protein
MSAGAQTPAPFRLPRGSGLAGMLARADAATAADMLLRVQRGSGNAAASALAASVLSRAPAEPAAPAQPGAEPAAPPAPQEADEPGGIGSSESLARYAASARSILDNWDRYDSPDKRAQAMLEAVNAELVAGGFPRVAAIALAPLAGTIKGYFDSQTWSMTVDSELFSGPKPGGGWAYRASVVAHEARHAEQHFLAARLAAGRGWKVAGLMNELGMSKAHAEAARAHPLEPDDPEAKEAEFFLDSLRGAAGRHERKVIERMLAAQDAYEKANAAYESAGPADKDALHGALVAAYDELRLAGEAYEALPMEADAQELSDAVQRAFLAGPPQ